METVFHARLYGGFIQIKSNFNTNKLYITNQGSSFLRGSFSKRYNVSELVQLRGENSPSILKDDFSSRKDTSILTFIAPELLD